MAKSKIEKRSLTSEELQQKIEFLKGKNKKFRVFYGFAKLTKKIVRKRELAVYFENGSCNSNDKYINQKIHIVHQRIQTIEEMTDFDIGNRSFTKYGYFIDDKIWKGDIERILEDNFNADSIHVSFDERTDIREKLRNEYYSFYGVDRQAKGQQTIIFN